MNTLEIIINYFPQRNSSKIDIEISKIIACYIIYKMKYLKIRKKKKIYYNVFWNSEMRNTLSEWFVN